MRRESDLHHALKMQYAGADGITEAGIYPAEGGDEGGANRPLYICDGVRADGEIIEVQTGSFAPLKDKVHALAGSRRVRIIYPVIVRKIIEMFDTDGVLVRTRASPRKGTKWDLFKALVYGWETAVLENVTVEIAFVDVAEKRLADGRGSWRRKGVSIADRRLLAQYPSIELRNRADYAQFAPFAPSEHWTTANLAARAGITPHLAQKTVFTLCALGIVRCIGKRGRSREYVLIPQEELSAAPLPPQGTATRNSPSIPNP